MEPKINQYVKLGFRNGSQIEGTVISWSSSKSLLKSIDGDMLVIMRTDEDVMVCKIITEKTSVKSMPQLEEEFKKIKASPSNDDLRIKNLAQLKIAMIEQEKQTIALKTKQHIPSTITPVQYGSPLIRK